MICAKSHSLQNFFTLVKALISDAKASGQKSDGYHHYEAQEAELTKA